MYKPIKCSFIIDFCNLHDNFPLKNYQFLDISGKVEKEEVKIFDKLDKYFENDGCSIRVCFRLFSSDQKQEIKFYFDLFHGDNYATCFLERKGKLFEFDFKNESTPITLELLNEKKIINYDTNNTHNRKRYLLINYNDLTINFNDKKINLIDFFPLDPKSYEKKSIKFTVYSLEKNYILSNFIETKEGPENYSEYYSKDFSLINKIQKDVKSLINNFDKGNKKNKLLKKIKSIISMTSIPKINLNISKQTLKEKLSKNEYLPYEINITLVRLLLHFLNEWENDFNMLKELYDYYKKITEKIMNDGKLQLYQKILLLNQYHATSDKFIFIKDFVNSKFNYYIVSNAQSNSVLSLTHNFFIEFASKLSEKHKAFDKLIELDGEFGYFEGERYFCYNMKNLTEVQTYLKQKIPEIITTFYSNNTDNCAFVEPFTGYTTINLNSFKMQEEIDIMKSLDETNIIKGKNYASKLITYLLHEVPGHINFSFSNACKHNSPFKYINESNEICQLVPEYDLSYDKNENKIFLKNKKYDSGSFFELLYGKIGNYYISQILHSLNNYGKLVDRVDLLLDNLDLFNEYIKMHLLAFLFDLNLDNYSTLSIEEEIIAIRDFLKNKNIDIEKLLNSIVEKDNKEENEEEDEEENEEDNKEETKEQNTPNNDEKKYSFEKHKDLQDNKITGPKEKIRSVFFIRRLRKKFPHLKNKLPICKGPYVRKFSLKDEMIRNLFINSHNLQDEYKRIHDDPNLSIEMKNEYYRILRTIITNDC